MFTAYFVFPFEFTSLFSYFPEFTSLFSYFEKSTSLLNYFPEFTDFFNSFIKEITVICQVMLSNITDLLNPLTYEENLVQEAREHEYRVNRIKEKLRYQKAYMATRRNMPYMNIWWRGWNGNPLAQLTDSEVIILHNLPTSRTYFQSADIYLYPNRFPGTRPGVRSCPRGSISVPATARLWLDMDEQQP